MDAMMAGMAGMAGLPSMPGMLGMPGMAGLPAGMPGMADLAAGAGGAAMTGMLDMPGLASASIPAMPPGLPAGMTTVGMAAGSLPAAAMRSAGLPPAGMPPAGLPPSGMPTLPPLPASVPASVASSSSVNVQSLQLLAPQAPIDEQSRQSRAEARRIKKAEIWAQLAQMGYQPHQFQMTPDSIASLTDLSSTTSVGSTADPNNDKRGKRATDAQDQDEDESPGNGKQRLPGSSWRPQLPRRGQPADKQQAAAASTHYARLAMYSQYVNAIQFQMQAAGYQVPGGTDAAPSELVPSPSARGGGGPFNGHDPKRKYTGVVTKWMDEEGFGFISCMESRRVYRKDVFLHKAEIGQEADLYKQRTKVDISRGDMVRFTVEISRGQPRAKDVEIIGHSDRILAPDHYGGLPGPPKVSGDEDQAAKHAAGGSQGPRHADRSGGGRDSKRRRHDDDGDR